ncbi:MAG: hypothetical protein JW953_07065 [Anaerolineae bacterium]|nr:hypothetical protein [Anaerolineae bacterium]
MPVRKIDAACQKDVRQFVEFPFDLYKDCSLWVPPLVSSVKHALNREKHPFYRHSAADFFVAEHNGQTLGRVAVLNNRNYNAFRRANTAFFGYFDAVEDTAVAQALFDAAFDWAKEQGLQTMVGPRGVLASEGGGILVEGFEYLPAMGIAYNFPYYDHLLSACGFEKDTDYVSGLLPGDYALDERFFKLAERAKTRRGFRVKKFRNKAELRAWVPRAIEAHRRAFENTHTYFPPTREETALIVDTLLSVAEPELIKLVLKDDDIVGFVAAYRDLSPGLQKAGGRLWPFGWFYIWQERSRAKRLNINGLGLLPEYRGLGVNTILYTELQKTVQTHPVEQMEIIQIEEGNAKSLAEMKAIGGMTWYKRHRSYQRAL